jgi:hypothetical protein
MPSVDRASRGRFSTTSWRGSNFLRAVLTVLVGSAAVAAVVLELEDPRREIDNVAAFARLYGVVRYFYPADAVTTVDWDRFAILGVSRVRGARDAAALETTLEGLFSSLGPGLEIGKSLSPAPPPGAVDAGLVVWQYVGPGIDASKERGPYSASRTNRRASARSPGGHEFVTLMQSVPAVDFRGKRVRLRGRARVATPDAPGSAGLWLRVDRGSQGKGFFDNMGDRPIRQTEWTEYVVEGPIAEDATHLAFGALASDSVMADFDALELAVGDGDTWLPIEIRDPGFEATGEAREAGWRKGGTSRDPQVERREEGAAEGERFLRILAAPGAGGSSPNTRTTTGAHVDVDLGRGLEARVPMALREADAATSSMESLRAAIQEVAAPAGRSDLDVRLADVVVAWNVFRHFYPYWEETRVDWDARLVPQLEASHGARTREAHLGALRQLVADLRDGHGLVIDPGRAETGALPIRLRLVGDRLVVFASSVPAEAPVGAVVAAIDGVSATERLESEVRLSSGTTQWRGWRALRDIASCVPGSTTRIKAEIPGGTSREVSLPCGDEWPAERRPEPLAELVDGIWYVDLTRAKAEQIEPALPKLAAASGVVFDLRGYPTDAGSWILPHLLAEPESDRWMHVANITGPFGQVADWQSFGWNLSPATPRLDGQRVFLTDGRAISYAESVMGYVKDRKLGTIVGGTTAGANGNVVSFEVPGGFSMRFTGMRVTGHDGRTPRHLAGISPDIPLEPTIAGLREGRDELLERAIALIRPK